MYRKTSNLLWLTAYLATMLGIIWGMNRYREWTTQTFDNPSANSQWQAWRNAVKDQQATRGSVLRRTPKSAEPPALVLMRDHFATCLVVSLVLSSALFLTLMVIIRGVLASSDGASTAED